MYAKCVRRVLITISCFVIVVAIDVDRVWAQADATIRGQVVAAADGSIVPASRVALRSEDARDEPRRAVVDPDGRFAFIGVRPGEYLLSASADGFAPRELRLVVAPREVRTA